ncbi:unnamed protein product, partial [Pocillopora meandrina]
SQVNQDVVLHILIVQRQRKSDEVTGRTGEADGLGGIPATQPPLTTPLERRHIPLQLSMTLEGEIVIFIEPLFCLEQSLTRTENKLRECLDNQQRITLQIRPNDFQLSIESDAVLLWFCFTSLCGWSTETQKDSRHNLNQSYVKLRPNTT